ncbi:diguanylate cyclase domain-containing protein [Zoogloea sp.]|uniref:bifunctional diguanylate cyclase/phosphodiesterase n=1 Tax=Zoogloea sp. TaxID=49181 RepID=UPI0035B1BF14
MISRLFPKLSTQPLQLIRLGIAGATLLALGIAWYDLLQSVEQNEYDTRARVRAQALLQSRVAAETVQATLDRFDFVLRTARASAGDRLAIETLREQVLAAAMPSDLILQLFRIDAAGYLSYSSLGEAPRNFLGDRAYFTRLASDAGDSLVISPPVLGRLTGKWSLQIARAVRRNGQFDGVVSLAVSPDAWTAQLARFESAPHDTLTLVDATGHVLLRTLDPGAHYGKQAPQQREYITRPDLREGDYVAHATVDGILRQYGWTRLPSGLVMMSGIALDDALAPMRAQNAWALERGAMFSLLFMLVIGALLVALRRYERVVHDLASHEAHLRGVLDNMAEGIMIIDTENRIVDINPAFSAITGFGIDELRGQHISTLPAGRAGGCSLAELLGPAELHHQRGDFDGRRRDGEAYTGHAMISAVLDAENHVTHRVALISDVTELRRRDGEIWQRANFDRLTGLPNRSLINDRLESMVHHAKRQHAEVVVLFIDLDRFKPVNDSFGHDIGDLLLQQVAKRLQRLFRDEDTVARLGGDEFVVAMPAQAGSTAVGPTAAKVVDALSQPFEVEGHTLRIACSVGVARFPADGENAERLLSAADHAMYRAKNTGRARWSA